MDYEKLSSESLDRIMSEIRKINGNTEENRCIGKHAVSNSEIKRDAELEGMETLLSEAAAGTQIGLRKAEMSRQKGLRRMIAKLIEKIYLRIAELTNRDVRVFSISVLSFLQCVCGKLESLFYNDQLLEDKLSIHDTAIRELQDLKEKLTQHDTVIGKLQSLEEKLSQQDTAIHDLQALNMVLAEDDARICTLQKNLNAQEQEIIELRKQCEEYKRETVCTVSDTEKCLKEYFNRTNEDFSEFVRRTKLEIDEQLALLHWYNLPEERKQEKLPVMKSQALDTVFYHDFEEHFRGSQNDIRHRLEVYIPLVLKRGKTFTDKVILDLGCGRGEMMDVLRENGADNVLGIDSNSIQLQICRGKGHTVLEQDCLAYLCGLDSGTVDYIFAIQLIEHLPFETMLAFFSECGRVLKKGGMLICETPNCENMITATKYFYVDPSHQHPIHPELARFIAERSGFSGVEIHGLNPDEYAVSLKVPEFVDGIEKICSDNVEVLNQLFFGPRDYALIGIRT